MDLGPSNAVSSACDATYLAGFPRVSSASLGASATATYPNSLKKERSSLAPSSEEIRSASPESTRRRRRRENRTYTEYVAAAVRAPQPAPRSRAASAEIARRMSRLRSLMEPATAEYTLMGRWDGMSTNCDGRCLDGAEFGAGAADRESGGGGEDEGEVSRVLALEKGIRVRVPVVGIERVISGCGGGVKEEGFAGAGGSRSGGQDEDEERKNWTRHFHLL
ncbi:Ral GTPase-activating protein subunit alpha-1, partial [Striga asiatica]